MMQADLAEANDRESAAIQKVSELMHELGLRRTAALLGTYPVCFVGLFLLSFLFHVIVTVCPG